MSLTTILDAVSEIPASRSNSTEERNEYAESERGDDEREVAVIPLHRAPGLIDIPLVNTHQHDGPAGDGENSLGGLNFLAFFVFV